MTTMLRDLVSLNKVLEQMKREVTDLLFDALDGKFQLFALATAEQAINLIPCKKEWIEEEGFFIDVYDKNDARYVEIEVGQVIALNQPAIKGLIVNKQFSVVELFRTLCPELVDTDREYWRTAEELYGCQKWVDGKANYNHVELGSIYMLKSDANPTKKSSVAASSEVPSNTSLKVIGLLMHHLAKSPKYAAGSSPNKSQIKELLLDLAEELGVSSYGLSKVDERLLAEAMKYLETQKN